MPRRTQTKKINVKKARTNPVGLKCCRKDLRFSISLVILIGMLAFSLLLLLFSLNKSVAVSAGTRAVKIPPVSNTSGLKKTVSQGLDDSSLDFKITVPTELGSWFYKIGEVKSLTDKSLSDQYMKIYVPLPGVKSNNFDQQYKEILTIRKFTGDEWNAIGDKCPSTKANKDICDAAGESIFTGPNAAGDEVTYAATKPTDCPNSIKAKCALADKIIQSFELK